MTVDLVFGGVKPPPKPPKYIKKMFEDTMGEESPWSDELQAAVEVLQVAADMSRFVQSMLRPNGGALINPKIAVTEEQRQLVLEFLKLDLTPVTVADLAIQAMVLTVLSNLFPQYGLVAEETADLLRENARARALVTHLIVAHTRENEYVWAHGCSDFETNNDHLVQILDRAGYPNGDGNTKKSFWVMDPIDGTAAFVKHQQYAINLGLIVDGIEVLGLVACPQLDFELAKAPGEPYSDITGSPLESPGTLLYAVRGHGAWALPLDMSLDPIRLPNLPECPSLSLSVSSIAVESGIHDTHKDVAMALGARHPHCDLQAWTLRWVSLALQHANFTVWVYEDHNRCAKIWDHAGAMLLYTEVGGVITDILGRPIDLTKGRILSANTGFAAASKRDHPILKAIVVKKLKDSYFQKLLDIWRYES
ncbi:hypothetical protein QBC34DRAFT_389691 [Podospora aff. communis PSN243]|uniref:Uncharacterized protein n=1 Tax=Podospora aff. communis PSN243 TaxID=3040156 RepID=A0AAV9H4C2_9PEZI|nr:hypothetical protein QBC34DRAFT_389691 [Podospora aff. communis PSN243]